MKGNHKHGLRKTPEYNAWSHMKQRCLNPNNRKYPNYGGRGITICDRWRDDFAAFYNDMGQRPEGTTLDRIEVNGHYEPANCRWADGHTQRVNRRPVRPGCKRNRKKKGE